MVIGLEDDDERRPLVTSTLWRRAVAMVQDTWIAFIGIFKHPGSLLHLLADHIHLSKSILDKRDGWIACTVVGSKDSLRFRRRPGSGVILDSIFGETLECDGVREPLKGRDSRFMVAAKRLLPVMLREGIDYDDATARLQKRLRREVELIAELNHPNVAPILGYYKGTSLDTQYLVTPWYSGGTLLHWVEVNRNWEEKFKMILGLANGLCYLSSEEVTHGDLRPANILIDSRSNPIISDFSLSAACTDGFESNLEEARSTARFSDFLRWLSLERLQLNSVSPADDIYAFGCLVLFILTNEVPYYTALSETEFWNQRSSYNPSSPEVRPPLSLQEGSTWWEVMDKCWLPAPSSADQMEAKECRPRMEFVFELVKQAVEEDPDPPEKTISTKF